MQTKETPLESPQKERSQAPAELKPGHVLVTLDDEIDNFEREVERFRADPEGLESTFVPFRLKHGTYGQRQPDQQMLRVKLPYGGVTAGQMDVLAEIAEKYSGLRRGHITTRENIQFHFVNLDDTPEAMRLLATVGLTTREACGHTVRNVTGCPYAGVCPDEIFDTTPYLAAYARNMLRNPVALELPRKFKTAFSCCPTDCAGTPFHDLGFIARVRGENGRATRGFQVVVGGGTSTMPTAANVLYDFVEADNGEYIRVAEAVLRVFFKEGGLPMFLRKNMNKARLKFLIKKIGMDEFKRQVEEELAQRWIQEPLDMPALMRMAPEGPTAGELPKNGHVPSPEFERWLQTNVRAQKQPGYVAVAVTVLLGNITPEQFHGLAEIMRLYSGGHARTNQNQNLVLRWVRKDALPGLHHDLTELGFGSSGAGLITDTVACPGTDSCKLGITSSQGVATRLREEALSWGLDDPEVAKITIKISGCPNGCGQHHLGAIGLQGSSYRNGLAEIPCYDILLGGGNYIGGGKFGERVARIPAKRALQAVRKIVRSYVDRRAEGESFLDFVDRVGAKSFSALLDEFKDVGPVHQEIDTYMDWGKEELFTVIRGEGECAM